MKSLALISILALPLLAEDPAPACCEHIEKSAEATTESIYQLDATWTNQHGEEISLADLKGGPVLITMGYATCKFACPRLAADLTAIEKKLTEAEREQINIVFVSIDPERDTPKKLKKFISQYGVDQSRWHALKGSEDAVLELSVTLGIRYRKVNESDFAHSNIIAVLSPIGEIAHRQEGLGADSKKTISTLRDMLKKSAEKSQ